MLIWTCTATGAFLFRLRRGEDSKDGSLRVEVLGMADACRDCVGFSSEHGGPTTCFRLAHSSVAARRPSFRGDHARAPFRYAILFPSVREIDVVSPIRVSSEKQNSIES